MNPQDRFRTITRVTLMGSAIDLSLGMTKLAVGWLSQSQALIADGVHSLSDLAADMVVIVAAKHASQDADEDHPYGHGRYETLATVTLAIVMMAVALGIAYEAVLVLLGRDASSHPGLGALLIALLSVLSKEWIYHYLMRAARELESDMLRASAWHSRSDAFSSVVVIIGIAGTMLGFPLLDALAAILVAGMIGHMAYQLGWKGIQQLVDAGLSAERVAQIEDIIRNIPGVVSLHMLRTRSLGTHATLDVHIQVKPRLSVSEGHYIAEHVIRKLKADIAEINDVTVHTDPEDDALDYLTIGLPPRPQVLQDLAQQWQDNEALKALHSANFHYLGGKLHLELCLPWPQQQAAAIAREAALRQGFAALAYAGELRIIYAPDWCDPSRPAP